MGRLAVETGVFPLYEVENGRYRLSPDMPKKLKPIKDYFKGQGRFRHLSAEDIEKIQEKVTAEFGFIDTVVLNAGIGFHVAPFLDYAWGDFERKLLGELKACRALAPEHEAQLLGYLRASRIEHGLLVNFGSYRFQIRKFIMSAQFQPKQPQPDAGTP